MKKILLICASILDEAGALHVYREVQLRLLLKACAKQYEMTVLIHAKRDKRCDALTDISGIRVCYDPAVPAGETVQLPTKTQERYEQFSRCAAVAEAYDWALAWDGLSSYALATLLCRVRADSKGVFVLEEPELYLMPEDRDFMRQTYSRLQRIDVSAETIGQSLMAYLQHPLFEFPVPATTFRLPENWELYRQKAEERFENPFAQDKVKLLAVARMTTESAAERLPALIAERKRRGEAVQCCLVGDGPRKRRYQYQIALCDVDVCFTLLGQWENIYPLIRHCDGVFLPDEEPDGPLHQAAGLFGIPVLQIDA